MKKKLDSSRDFRGAGVLLPVSSLPSPFGIGTLGEEAFRFIDFLKNAGQSYWQVLPVGPTGYGDSPYQSFSAFAGNPYFIDLTQLEKDGLLAREELEQINWGHELSLVDYGQLWKNRFSVLRLAFGRSNFKKTEDYLNFCKEHSFWLEDYSLYMALKTRFNHRSWLEWPEEFRFYKKERVEQYRKEFIEEIDFWKFCQFLFFSQWIRLKDYAAQNGVKIIGDIPIYVALDSADVWSRSELFQLDAQRRPAQVAGVPPDLFSETGQLWGNPLYDWEKMEKTGFLWWKRRMEFSARLYNVLRIDHFIGIARYYSIPAGETTAINGQWKEGPGIKLIRVMNSAVGNTEIIAEDLGVVVPSVRRLLKQSGYPGMKVLAFAFDGDAENDHLPHFHEKNSVVYCGTHDNETLAGYFCKRHPHALRYAKEYLNIHYTRSLPWAIIRAAYASVANTAIIQAQDLLELDNSSRMNFPSTMGNNWRWRLEPGQLTDSMAERMRELARVYGRLPKEICKQPQKG